MIVSITISCDQQALLHHASSDHCSLTLTKNNHLEPASTIVIRNNAYCLPPAPTANTYPTLSLMRGPIDGLRVDGPAWVFLQVSGVCFWSIIAPGDQVFTVVFSSIVWYGQTYQLDFFSSSYYKIRAIYISRFLHITFFLFFFWKFQGYH